MKFVLVHIHLTLVQPRTLRLHLRLNAWWSCFIKWISRWFIRQHLDRVNFRKKKDQQNFQIRLTWVRRTMLLARWVAIYLFIYFKIDQTHFFTRRLVKKRKKPCEEGGGSCISFLLATASRREGATTRQKGGRSSSARVTSFISAFGFFGSCRALFGF